MVVIMENNIGKRIKKYRTLKNYSQRKLATLCKISNSSISRIESGIIMPEIETLQTIAKALGVKPSDLLDSPNKIPVLGSIPAGIPLEAIEDILDYEEITPELAIKGEFFGLKVKGNSMSPQIADGDIVIVRKQDTCENNEIAVVLINGYEATLKIVQKSPIGITLRGYNPAFEPKFYSNEEIESLPIKILGVVYEQRRSWKKY